MKHGPKTAQAHTELLQAIGRAQEANKKHQAAITAAVGAITAGPTGLDYAAARTEVADKYAAFQAAQQEDTR